METLGSLAAFVGGKLIGDSGIEISGAASLSRAGAGDISFAATKKYFEQGIGGKAAAFVVGPDVAPRIDQHVIVVDDPEPSFAKIVALFRPPVVRVGGSISELAHVSSTALIADDVTIHPGAVISDNVKIGCGTTIHSNVTLLENCQIGANVTIFPGCTIYENSVIGDRCMLHAGVVIGGYGFGYKTSGGQHRLASQLGYVIVENDVEIGANSTIDRGTFDATVIGEGSKLDNQVMIGHNCQIGRHNLLCSQVGIAGSSTTGDYVIMGGQVGVGDHLNIGTRAMIMAKSGLMHDVPDGQAMAGNPARGARERMQVVAASAKLPSMRKEFRKVLRRLDEVESTIAPDENPATIHRPEAA